MRSGEICAVLERKEELRCIFKQQHVFSLQRRFSHLFNCNTVIWWDRRNWVVRHDLKGCRRHLRFLHGEDETYTERMKLTRRGWILHGEDETYTERMKLTRRGWNLHGEDETYTERRNLTRRGWNLHGENETYTERMNLTRWGWVASTYRSSVKKYVPSAKKIIPMSE